jgi:hypothetical protein
MSSSVMIARGAQKWTRLRMRNRVHQPSGCLGKVIVRTHPNSGSHQGFAQSLAESAVGRSRHPAGLFSEASAL